MADEKKEEGAQNCRKCGGCKFFAGMLVGLLLAGTGLGIYLAGTCGHCRSVSMMKAGCPFSGPMGQMAPMGRAPAGR
jgi:hypothetical protein